MPRIEQTIQIEEHIKDIVGSLRKQGIEQLSDQYLYLIENCTKFAFCEEITVLKDFAAFRARKNIDETKENIEDVNTFSYPNSIVCKKNGRANIAEKPVFYSAENVNVALNEVWPQKDDIIHLSIWRLKGDVSNFRVSVCLSDDISKDNLWYGANLRIKDAIKRELDYHDQTSAIDLFKLLAKTFFSEKYPYLMSSTAAYLFLYAYGIDALVYPSFSWRARFCNYALNPGFVDRNLEILGVYKLHVRESNQVADIVDLVSVGTYNGAKILWREPSSDDYRHYAAMCSEKLVIPFSIKGPEDYSKAAKVFEKSSRKKFENVSYLDAESDPGALVRIAAIDDEGKIINELKSYLEIYPNCHVGCFLMASWANDQNNFHDAIHYYTRAIKLRPGSTRYHYNRGNAYFKLGDLDKALADYSMAIECGTSQDKKISDYLMKSHCNRGSIYQEMGSHERAASDFQMALQYDNRDYFSHFNLGNCLLLDQKYEEAIESYNNAIQIKQDDGEVYQNRAIAYLKIGKKEQAEKDFMKAKELSS